MKIVLDLPPKALSPNARVHWAVKARATKKYRKAAEMLAREHGVIRYASAHVGTIFYVKDKRGLRQDADNLIASLKAAFDGLADAGVVENDKALTPLPPKLDVDKHNPRVEMFIKGDICP